MRDKLEVWYDGACPLCTREIALMRRLDRRGAIDFVDVSTPGGSCPIDRKALLERFHAREDLGKASRQIGKVEMAMGVDQHPLDQRVCVGRVDCMTPPSRPSILRRASCPLSSLLK